MSAVEAQEAPGTGAPSPTLQRVIDAIKGMATVSELLRILGAAVIVASMSLFLLQGWHEGNDVQRYLKLLAQTGLLGAGGLLLSYGLKEAKGARVFFGLALVSIAANFTVLGALVYSLYQLDGGLSIYPAFATWQIGDVASIGLTMLGALAVLLPVARFCFAIMARSSASALTLHFALLNALLLIPMRWPVAASVLALAGGAYAVWAVRGLKAKDVALSTREGKFALGVLFLPLAIMLVRSLLFYAVDSVTVVILALTALLALRQVAVTGSRGRGTVGALNALSILPAGVVAFAAGDALASVLHTEWLVPMMATAFAVMALEIMLRTPQRALRTVIALITCVLFALSFAFVLALDVTLVNTLVTLAAGAFMMVLGGSILGRSGTVIGAMLVLGAGWAGLDNVAYWIKQADWMIWAMVGAGAIALGSVLERHGVAMRMQLAQWSRVSAQGKEAVLDN